MISRYTPKAIGEVWTDQAKFDSWLDVELAMIKARSQLGPNEPGKHYQPEIYEKIKAAACFTVAAVNERDREIEHDLQAFVDVVRQSLPLALRKYLHDEMTSFDTEVPALALKFRDAGKILLADLDALISALRKQATIHLWTYCMGMTHGMDAKPTTFGWRLCSYIELLENAKRNLQIALDNINLVKCSGAIGNYMTITPDEENRLCQILGLGVRPAATQIVGRDVFSYFLSVVATAGGCIEKIATDLRLLASSRFNEVREPRRAKQKGSSAMPHKKNPILLERMCGMAIALRGYAAMGQELIRTWLERDISHSSAERIAFPDATILFDYMLQKMTWIIYGLEVNREQMARNIENTRGIWAAEEVKNLLGDLGYDPDAVYNFVQQVSFEAEKQGTPFKDLALISVFPPGSDTPLKDTLARSFDFNDCFSYHGKLRRLTAAYERMGLDIKSPDVLPPNI